MRFEKMEIHGVGSEIRSKLSRSHEQQGNAVSVYVSHSSSSWHGFFRLEQQGVIRSESSSSLIVLLYYKFSTQRPKDSGLKQWTRTLSNTLSISPTWRCRPIFRLVFASPIPSPNNMQFCMGNVCLATFETTYDGLPRPWTCSFATRANEVNGSYTISYKVVLVVPPKQRVLDPSNYSSIEIFSSDIGCWECVPGPISVPQVVFKNGYKAQDFCYKGTLHWLDQEGGARTIVTYDPHESPNRFGHIRMPHNAGGYILSISLMSLVHLGDEDEFPRCCEIEHCPNDMSPSLLVWRLVDYDKQLWWCLEQRCALSPDSLQLLRGCRQLIAAPDPQNPPLSRLLLPICKISIFRGCPQ